MEEGSCGEHSEDDKVLPHKSKKRMVKTPTQIEALEKFYDEHKYPSELMKVQLGESIGLTDKQVSGWFRNRRLKDKRLAKGETRLIERQDHSSGVIQDRGSGLRQDSCGSTKQGDDKNFETREVESGRLNLPAYQQNRHCQANSHRMDDETSGSSSSLRNMSFHKTDPSDVASSTYLLPKFPVEVKGLKARSGPSGFLKMRNPVENSAITDVKRQLGKHYQEGGPPLGVDFDTLPPGAFESPMQNRIDEPVLPISSDVSKHTQNPRFHKDSKLCGERRMLNESAPHQFKIPSKNETHASRMGGFQPPQYYQRSLAVENTPWSSTRVMMRSGAVSEMPSGSREDEGSTETSSSVD